MIEKLLIAFFSFVLGIFLFKQREQYLTRVKVDKIKRRLQGKLLFWIIEEWGKEFEKIFIVGHALSEKFDYLENFELIEKNKAQLSIEIEKRIVEVQKHINKNQLSKALIGSIPTMHERQFELISSNLDSYLLKIENGVLLLSKDEIDYLDAPTQIYYLNLESHLIRLINQIKTIFYDLRYSEKIETDKLNDQLIDLAKFSIRTTMAISLLQKRI